MGYVVAATDMTGDPVQVPTASRSGIVNSADTDAAFKIWTLTLLASGVTAKFPLP